MFTTIGKSHTKQEMLDAIQKSPQHSRDGMELAIRRLASFGSTEDALELLNLMRSSRQTPSGAVYTRLITLVSKINPQLTANLIEIAASDGCKPDVIAFN